MIVEKSYKTPNDWYNANRNQLKNYKAEWIAFTNKGVIVHDKDLFKVAKATNNLLDSQYTIDYIFDSEFVKPVRFKRSQAERGNDHIASYNQFEFSINVNLQ